MPDKFYELDGFPIWMKGDWLKWYDVARSYRRAAEILIDAEGPERDYYSERDVLPILNLLHLYAELVLKALLVRNGDPVMRTHNIALLKGRAGSIHPDICDWVGWDLIDRLSTIDSTGAALRYPVDPDAKSFFEDPQGANTFRLSDVVCGSRDFFRSATNFFQTKLLPAPAIIELLPPPE